jgi:hypothetical protein
MNPVSRLSGALFTGMVIFIFLFAAPATTAELYQGQTLYVPAYSHIYQGPKAVEFDLTCTLSIRNTDMSSSIEIVSVIYYDSGGELVRRYQKESVILERLSTREYIVDLDDRAGGSGAKFMVVWRAEKPVNPPLVEAVMIGTQGNQGISFTSRAQPVAVPVMIERGDRSADK